MNDDDAMRRALELAGAARLVAHPNPWVGCVIVGEDGIQVAEGATEEPGGRHGERVALDVAGERAQGATLVATLEPCVGFAGKRTPSCAEAIIAAGVARVVVALEDPDPRVAGRGIAALRAAGVEVEIGRRSSDVATLLAPYVHHRRTGRPYVVLKLAASIDGRTAAPDGTSRWITGVDARRDAHVLRAESDAVVVGAGTVRADDPELTVRHVPGRDPRRVVLGRAPDGAKVHPCDERSGDLTSILDALGAEGVVQVLVEGGATVASAFHGQALVERYVIYLAPALFGGTDGLGLFNGPGAATMADVWRGRITDVRMVGTDLRVDLERAS